MKRIAMISITLNALRPMTEFIERSGADLYLVNFLDTGLMDLVEEEGRVTNRSLSRLLSLIARADEDRVDGALLTCTVFSPYAERLRSLFTFPIISADGAMIETAVRREGKTLILCTFPATRDSATALFHAAEQRLGVSREMEVVLLEEAYAAIKRGDRREHDRLVLTAAREAHGSYDQIVLAQMSMAHLAGRLGDTPILTSPQSALEALTEALEG